LFSQLATLATSVHCLVIRKYRLPLFLEFVLVVHAKASHLAQISSLTALQALYSAPTTDLKRWEHSIPTSILLKPTSNALRMWSDIRCVQGTTIAMGFGLLCLSNEAVSYNLDERRWDNMKCSQYVSQAYMKIRKYERDSIQVQDGEKKTL
jgi:hypothetical protein